MKTNINKRLQGWLLTIPVKLRRYSVLILLLGSFFTYGYILYQIDLSSRVGPNEERLSERTDEIKQLRIDEENIERLERLEDQNIAVQTLFKDARDNPFEDN